MQVKSEPRRDTPLHLLGCLKETVTSVGVCSFLFAAVIKYTQIKRNMVGHRVYLAYNYSLSLQGNSEVGAWDRWDSVCPHLSPSLPQSRVERNGCTPAFSSICLLALFSLIHVFQGLTWGKCSPRWTGTSYIKWQSRQSPKDMPRTKPAVQDDSPIVSF